MICICNAIVCKDICANCDNEVSCQWISAWSEKDKQKALDVLEKTTLPTRKVEAWKYTRTTKLGKINFINKKETIGINDGAYNIISSLWSGNINNSIIYNKYKPGRAVLKDDQHEFVDAIGDMVVVLTNMAHLGGTTIEECIDAAYKVISKRTGKMVNGTFVKDEK